MQRSIIAYFRPHITMICVIIILHIIGVALQLDLINITRPLINVGVKQKNMDLVIQLGCEMIVLVGMYAVDRVLVSHISAKITGKVITNLRRDLYHSLLSADEGRIGSSNSGKMMTTVTSDVSSLEDYITSILTTYTYIPILLIGLVICTTSIDVRFGAIMFAVFIVIAFMILIAGKRIIPAYARQQDCLDRVNDVLKECIVGSRNIRAEGNTPYQEARFDAVNEELGKANRLVNLSTYFMQPMAAMMMNVTVVIICAIFAINSDEAIISTGNMVVLFQYVTYFLMCVPIVPFLCVVVPRMLPLKKRIYEVLSLSDDEEDGRTGHPNSNSDSALRLDSVSITRSSSTVATGLDLDIKRGEKVAIVGDNVSGKEGIPAAIMGFANVSEGKISMGDTDIMEISKGELRSSVSYVADRAQMFRDTFRNNIDPYGTCSEERMDMALDASGFRDVVESSPMGMDTLVTNEGNSISGGQRQKLAIARCLAKRSDLYIFDRCFYSLDTLSKLGVMDGIKNVLKDSTVMVVTSNVELVRDFERIIVMQNGRIIASGNDAELSKNCSVYRRLIDEGAVS